ncbi:MAG: EAL domain-containing protein [bacterium]
MSIFVARQPIFDRTNHVFGYELLYRRDESRTTAEGTDANTMSARVISNAFLGVGIGELTGGVPGFVNFTRDQLVDATYELFDPAEVVVELLETVHCDDETLQACRAMHHAGYQFALDDFVYDPSFDPLLALASIVKVDVLGREESDIRDLLSKLGTFKGLLLAERVETEDVHRACSEMGFQLFQGYFYARPETVAKEDLEAGQLTILRLLTLLRDGETSDAQIEIALRADAALCYKLLRMANSASMGGQGVESIKHALRMVGRTSLHRWLAIILAGSFVSQGGANKELGLNTLARARLCEVIARRSSRRLAPDPLFMVGILSMMDALMRVPMARVLSLVEVSTDVHSALLERTGPLANALLLVEAYDAGQWDVVKRLAMQVGVDAEQVPGFYFDAVTWARAQLSLASV